MCTELGESLPFLLPLPILSSHTHHPPAPFPVIDHISNPEYSLVFVYVVVLLH